MVLPVQRRNAEDAAKFQSGMDTSMNDLFPLPDVMVTLLDMTPIESVVKLNCIQTFVLSGLGVTYLVND